MADRLFVHFRRRLVGEIALTPAGLMEFEYDHGWLARTESFPISLSLPLDGSFSEHASHYFFANLLPEGNVREQICRALKISPRNDYGLLEAIGGDCAGALTITATDIPAADELPRYAPITPEQLSVWSIGRPDAFSAITGRDQMRLSLAGAQDKLPVCVEGDNLMVPLGGTPSTHILKFASPHYSHLPENETFMTLLAEAVGLPVVKISLLKTSKSPVALIARYDRRQVGNRWQRLHQEDFCQAIGRDAARKYEKEGGPSLRQCIEVIRGHAAYPLLEVQKLLQWVLFNWLTGNADGHAKNLSLLYATPGSPNLAPFYDLVCTRNYKKISRELAMNLGGAWDPAHVLPKHLDGLAKDIGVRPRLVADETARLIEKIADSLQTVAGQYGERFGESSVLERLPIVIRSSLRRAKSQIG